MTIFAFLFSFLGSFFLYNSSKKATLTNKLIIEKWLQQNTKIAKVLSIFCFFVTLFLGVNQYGVSSGILITFFIITLMLSLIIVISPTQQINFKHLIGLFLVVLILKLVSF